MTTNKKAAALESRRSVPNQSESGAGRLTRNRKLPAPLSSFGRLESNTVVSL